MRSIALTLELAVLLPIVFVRPFVGVLLWSWISFMNPHRLVYGGIALSVPWAMLIFFATIFGCLAARSFRAVGTSATRSACLRVAAGRCPTRSVDASSSIRRNSCSTARRATSISTGSS